MLKVGYKYKLKDYINQKYIPNGGVNHIYYSELVDYIDKFGTIVLVNSISSNNVHYNHTDGHYKQVSVSMTIKNFIKFFECDELLYIRNKKINNLLKNEKLPH